MIKLLESDSNLSLLAVSSLLSSFWTSLISSVWSVGITALSDTLISFLSWTLESVLSSLLESLSLALDLSKRTCSVKDWTRLTWLAIASSETFSPSSKRLFSSVNWESWLDRLNKLSSSAFAIAAWSSLRAWLRADLSTDFLAIASFSDPTSCDFSECPSVGGTPSVKPVTATPTFSVLAVAGETAISALATPLAKNINAAMATLAAPKWYLRIE